MKKAEKSGIKINILAPIYYVLQSLANSPLTFTTSYRIERNIAKLKNLGEKYGKEIQEGGGTIEAEIDVQNKWESSGETEDFDLKILDFSKEDIRLTPQQIRILTPILTFPED